MCTGVGAVSVRLLTFTHAHTRLTGPHVYKTVLARLGTFVLRLETVATRLCVFSYVCSPFLCFLSKSTISKFNKFNSKKIARRSLTVVHAQGRMFPIVVRLLSRWYTDRPTVCNRLLKPRECKRGFSSEWDWTNFKIRRRRRWENYEEHITSMFSIDCVFPHNCVYHQLHEIYIYICVCVCVCVYIYIYIFRCYFQKILSQNCFIVNYMTWITHLFKSCCDQLWIINIFKHKI